MADSTGMFPVSLEQNKPEGERDKRKRLTTLMESLRGRTAHHKTWVDCVKAVRGAISDKRHQPDSIDKGHLQRCLDSLQRAIKVITQQSLIERLETIARQLSLSSSVQSGGTEQALTISSDMFHVQVFFDKGGGVKDVKVAHGGEAQSCPELVEVLSQRDFSDFATHLAGLLKIYQIDGDKKVKSKAFLSLQSLESDLNLLAQLQSSINGVGNYIHKSPLGILLPRKGGLPMKLIYFVSPYDLLDKKTKSAHPMTVEAITEHDLGQSVTVCLEASQNGSLSKLQTMPLMTVVNRDGKGIPSFQGLSNINSYSFPARFVLVLPEPIPLALSVVEKIQSHTNLEIDASPETKPLLSLILNKYCQGKTLDSKELYVTLPDQQHVYFVNNVNGSSLDQPGVMVSRIPFSHPMNVAHILGHLRQQLVFNTVISSCIRPNSKQDLCNSVVVELTTISLQQICVTMEHPVYDAMLNVELDLNDITSLKCRLTSSPTDQVICSDEFASRVFQRCLSIPITLRSVIKKGREQLKKLLDERLEAIRLALFQRTNRPQPSQPPSIPNKGRQQVYVNPALSQHGQMSPIPQMGVPHHQMPPPLSHQIPHQMMPHQIPHHHHHQQMSPNQMMPNRMSPNQMVPNRMSPNQMGVNRMSPSQMGVNRMSPNQMGINRLSPNQMMPNHMPHNQMHPNQYPPHSMADARGQMPMADMRGQMDMRAQMPDMRGQLPEMRGQMMDMRGQMHDMRGQMPDIRGQMSDLRGSIGDLLSPQPDKISNNPLLATLLDQASEGGNQDVNDSPMLSKLLEDQTSVTTAAAAAATAAAAAAANPPSTGKPPTLPKRVRKRRSTSDQLGRSPKHNRVSDSEGSDKVTPIDLDSSCSPFDSSVQGSSGVPSSSGLQSIIDLTEESFGESNLKKLVDSMDSLMPKDQKTGSTDSELTALLSDGDPGRGLLSKSSSPGSKNENASTSLEDLLAGSGEGNEALDPASPLSSSASSIASDKTASRSAFLGHRPSSPRQDSKSPNLSSLHKDLFSQENERSDPLYSAVFDKSVFETKFTSKTPLLKSDSSAGFEKKEITGLFEKFGLKNETDIVTTSVVKPEEGKASLKMKLPALRHSDNRGSLSPGVSLESLSNKSSGKQSNVGTFDFKSDEDEDEPLPSLGGAERLSVYAASPTRLQITNKSKNSFDTSSRRKSEKNKRKESKNSSSGESVKRKKGKDESKKERKKRKLGESNQYSSVAVNKTVYHAAPVDSDQKSVTKLKIRVSKEPSFKIEEDSQKKSSKHSSVTVVDKLIVTKHDFKDPDIISSHKSQSSQKSLHRSSSSSSSAQRSASPNISQGNSVSKSDPKLATKTTIRLKPLNIINSGSSVTVQSDKKSPTTPSVRTSVSTSKTVPNSSRAQTPVSSKVSLSASPSRTPTSSPSKLVSQSSSKTSGCSKSLTSSKSTSSLPKPPSSLNISKNPVTNLSKSPSAASSPKSLTTSSKSSTPTSSAKTPTTPNSSKQTSSSSSSKSHSSSPSKSSQNSKSSSQGQLKSSSSESPKTSNSRSTSTSSSRQSGSSSSNKSSSSSKTQTSSSSRTLSSSSLSKSQSSFKSSNSSSSKDKVPLKSSSMPKSSSTSSLSSKTSSTSSNSLPSALSIASFLPDAPTASSVASLPPIPKLSSSSSSLSNSGPSHSSSTTNSQGTTSSSSSGASSGGSVSSTPTSVTNTKTGTSTSSVSGASTAGTPRSSTPTANSSGGTNKNNTGSSKQNESASDSAAVNSSSTDPGGAKGKVPLARSRKGSLSAVIDKLTKSSTTNVNVSTVNSGDAQAKQAREKSEVECKNSSDIRVSKDVVNSVKDKEKCDSSEKKKLDFQARKSMSSGSGKDSAKVLNSVNNKMNKSDLLKVSQNSSPVNKSALLENNSSSSPRANSVSAHKPNQVNKDNHKNRASPVGRASPSNRPTAVSKESSVPRTTPSGNSAQSGKDKTVDKYSKDKSRRQSSENVRSSSPVTGNKVPNNKKSESSSDKGSIKGGTVSPLTIQNVQGVGAEKQSPSQKHCSSPLVFNNKFNGENSKDRTPSKDEREPFRVPTPKQTPTPEPRELEDTPEPPQRKKQKVSVTASSPKSDASSPENGLIIDCPGTPRLNTNGPSPMNVSESPIRDTPSKPTGEDGKQTPVKSVSSSPKSKVLQSPCPNQSPIGAKSHSETAGSSGTTRHSPCDIDDELMDEALMGLNS